MDSWADAKYDMYDRGLIDENGYKIKRVGVAKRDIKAGEIIRVSISPNFECDAIEFDSIDSFFNLLIRKG